jgi:pimeloyl-ACP methyl ester carboxylesterase
LIVSTGGGTPSPAGAAGAAAARAPGGEARTVLLLHGQPGWARDWQEVSTAIGSRAIAINRPGWDGRSVATDLDGNGRAALATLDRFGVERAVIVGHSLGGAVAAWLGVHQPARVERLVLAAPAANVASLYAFDRWLAAPVLGELASATALGGLGLALAAGPVRRRIGAGVIDDRHLRRVGRRLLEPGVWRSFVAEQRALVRDLPALELGLGRVSAPTTIVCGSADRIVPLSSARRLASQIWGAELVVAAGAGHLLPLQRAGLLAEIIGS